jgi:hypothetical protein
VEEEEVGPEGVRGDGKMIMITLEVVSSNLFVVMISLFLFHLGSRSVNPSFAKSNFELGVLITAMYTRTLFFRERVSRLPMSIYVT